ncbi:hypothetical protein SO180_13110 [Bradyrhizobium sp. UFLA05-112]
MDQDEDQKPPRERERTDRTEDARKVAEEYAELQRQIAERLRRKMN